MKEVKGKKKLQMGKLFQLLRGAPIQWMSVACRRMATTKQTDHLTVTEMSTRKEILAEATVTEIKNESETVKRLTLQVQNRDFTFKAGQWVDTFIPSVETVGGFSMCSSPGLLQSAGILLLAVKFSKHPPAHWIHTKCKIGDTLLLRAGGDFYFDPKPEEGGVNVLLVAGGVGINPMYSMVSHMADLNAGARRRYPGKMVLLYSAKTFTELIFKNHIEEISSNNPNILAHFFATRDPSVTAPVHARRIGREDIEKVLKDLGAKKLKVYMCGPSRMIHDMEDHCFACGVIEKQIFYERWW